MWDFYKDYIENGYAIQLLILFNVIIILNQVMDHFQGIREPVDNEPVAAEVNNNQQRGQAGSSKGGSSGKLSHHRR
ncbi:hypothetical protein CAEBREN_09887 [Caenorhabditis brenneri]|uniref:Uncharacterized protein n=1 Tax=Caenorhabditis brenneri TaxID=135651 RepID=G0NPK1_CAEBE|nr:hypothetical protein CAEBREN_09887 [Caenorhabditis brenneri]